MRTATIDLDWLEGRIRDLDSEWLEEERIIRKNQLLSQLVILKEVRDHTSVSIPHNLPKCINCPQCGQPALLKSTHITMSYNGKDYDIDQWYYWCVNEKLDVTTKECLTKTFSQIPGYREE